MSMSIFLIVMGLEVLISQPNKSEVSKILKDNQHLHACEKLPL